MINAVPHQAEVEAMMTKVPIRWLLLLALVRTSSAEPIEINNLPRDSTASPFGELEPGTGGAYYAQSFVAPARLIEHLQFEMRAAQRRGSYYPDDTHFRVLLTTVVGEGGESRPGVVLFESDPLALPRLSDWSTFAVDLGGIPLAVGQRYAFVLDAFAEFDGKPGAAQVGVRSGYRDGNLFFLVTPESGTREDHFAEEWHHFEVTDLAFKLTFLDRVLFRRGDANADNAVDLSDGLIVALYLFRGREEPPCLSALDGNDDGIIDLSDIVGLLSYVFLHGFPPSAPFAACGADRTDDGLTCDGFPPCSGEV